MDQNGTKIKTIYKNNVINFNINEFNNIVKLISDCIGNIYVTGIGKSENIANHFCNLLK